MTTNKLHAIFQLIFAEAGKESQDSDYIQWLANLGMDELCELESDLDKYREKELRGDIAVAYIKSGGPQE